MALTDKQRRFVDEYLIDLNATQAAIRSGYAVKRADAMGYENLRKPEIAAELRIRMKDREQRTEVTQDYVIKTIRETIERCRQAHPVLDRKGEQVFVREGDGENAELVPAFTFDAGAVLKGAELLGKHLKMFTEKVEHSGGIAHTLTDAELDAKIAALKA